MDFRCIFNLDALVPYEPQLLANWQDPANTLDGLTLIEAEQRNRERENPSSVSGHSATQPTVVEQLQAAINEFETNPPEDKGEAHDSVHEH